MIFVKQSTAVDAVIGPFVDDTDGKTAETALTISQADCQLMKNGGAAAQKNDVTSATHLANGHYKVPLNTTDTGTLGVLRLSIHETGALPCFLDMMVMPANVWDSLFGADALQVHAVEITAGLITAAAIATGAIDADAIAADAVTEIQAGLATAAALDTVDNFLDTEIADIQSRLPAALVSGRIDASVGAMAVNVMTAAAAAADLTTELQSGLALEATLATVATYIDTEVAAIKAKTDNLPSDPADQSAVEAAILAAWTTALTESYAADGVAPTPAQILFLISQHLSESSISGTTKTVKKLDGTTTAATFTLDDATTPTSITRAT